MQPVIQACAILMRGRLPAQACVSLVGSIAVHSLYIRVIYTIVFQINILDRLNIYTLGRQLAHCLLHMHAFVTAVTCEDGHVRLHMQCFHLI